MDLDVTELRISGVDGYAGATGSPEQSSGFKKHNGVSWYALVGVLDLSSFAMDLYNLWTF